MKRGSLIVVGTEIPSPSYLTGEATSWIQASNKVISVAMSPPTDQIIRGLNPTAVESLNSYFGEGKLLEHTHRQIVNRVLECVSGGWRTAFVAFGQFDLKRPLLEAIRCARVAGYSARMLAAINAEQCLFADLGIDAGDAGCQSFEATSFLTNRRRLDPSTVVVLNRIGLVGRSIYTPDEFDVQPGLQALVDYLCEFYSPDQQVILYAAAPESDATHLEVRVKLSDLPRTQTSCTATLCILPDEQTSEPPFLA